MPDEVTAARAWNLLREQGVYVNLALPPGHAQQPVPAALQRLGRPHARRRSTRSSAASAAVMDESGDAPAGAGRAPPSGRRRAASSRHSTKGAARNGMAALPWPELDRHAGVPADLPGEIVGAAGEGQGRLGQPQEAQALALRSAARTSGARGIARPIRRLGGRQGRRHAPVALEVAARRSGRPARAFRPAARCGSSRVSARVHSSPRPAPAPSNGRTASVGGQDGLRPGRRRPGRRSPRSRDHSSPVGWAKRAQK